MGCYGILQATQINGETYADEAALQGALEAHQAVATGSGRDKVMAMRSSDSALSGVLAQSTYRIPCRVVFYFSNEAIMQSVTAPIDNQHK